MQCWQRRTLLSYVLWPLSLVYYAISNIRKVLYQINILPQKRLPIPVIVVGNIYVGGTGKTPFVIALVHYLQKRGYKPGIVSRGYKGKANGYPCSVDEYSDVTEVGDEAMLLYGHCHCPVVVDPKRARGATALLAQGVDIIVSDDGLQHYALARDIEIVLIDAERMFGNGLYIPAGPLRESKSRLKTVDFIVMHGQQDRRYSPWHFSLQPSQWVNCKNPEHTLPLNEFTGKTVHAVAGIGYPTRFFRCLTALGLSIIEHPFPDHHAFKLTDLQVNDDFPLVMTEKDSVKCQRFARADWWYLQVRVKISDKFFYSNRKMCIKCSTKEEARWKVMIIKKMF